MRVMLVNDFYEPHIVGGAETLVRGLAAGMRQRGHAVTVVTARLFEQPASDDIDDVAVMRIGRFPILPRARRLASGTAPQPLSEIVRKEFLEAIARVCPDVVHFHNVWLLGPEIVRLAPHPRGVTLHDYWPICVRRSLIRVGGVPCDGPSAVPCRCCRLRAPASLRSFDHIGLERERREHALTLGSCDFVTAPSRFLAERVANGGPLPHVVYNGIAADAPTGTASAEPYVLFASRATPEKGYPVALRAFSLPELSQIPLRVAADAPATPLPNVTVLGWQRSETLGSLIAGASCIVVPSVWPENCPMIVLEALRAGVPVVASRIGGIPELVEDGMTGILVPPGDAEALARAIRRCLNNEELRRHARERGPAVVSERFSLDAMVARLENLYAI
jgi:glycosyltransferase involved in cell wall biosynthesis